MSRPLVDIAVILKLETEKAFGIEDESDPTKIIWLPKSQCEYDQDSAVMTMPEWLAAEKKLI